MYEIGLKVYDGEYYSYEVSVTITVESNVQSHKGYIEVASEPCSQFAGQLPIITASLPS